MSELGDPILAGLEDALAFSRGKRGKRRVHRVTVPRRVNVKAIRMRLGMTQAKFANTFGFTLHSPSGCSWSEGPGAPAPYKNTLTSLISLKATLTNPGDPIVEEVRPVRERHAA